MSCLALTGTWSKAEQSRQLYFFGSTEIFSQSGLLGQQQFHLCQCPLLLFAAWDGVGETQTQLCHDLCSCSQPWTAAAAQEQGKMAQPLFITIFVV